MSIGIDKLAHMNTPALSDILLAHSAAEGTGVIAIGDLPKLLNAGNLKMPDSEETIAEHYRQFCNRNLLDNWYFANSVNQRGQTEYSVQGHNIDRWIFIGGLKITITKNGIKISNASKTDYGFFIQRLESKRFESEKIITLSVLANSNLYSVSDTLLFASDDSNPVGCCSTVTPFGKLRMYSFKNSTEFTIDIAPGQEVLLQAAKLELGSFQTLAHKEGSKWVLNEIPDYATELAKCQRYFYKTQGAFEYRGIAINQWYMNNGTIELPVSMRIKPTCKVFDRHGNAGKISIRNNDESVNGILTPLSNRTLLAYAPDAGFTIGTEYDFAIEADANL